MNEEEKQSIRRRTLAALAGNRAPGFHFAGYFLGLEWPRIDAREATQAMYAGPHCLDVNDQVNPAAVGVMIDGALATAARLGIESGSRLATVNLTLQYTGRPITGALSMDAELDGYYESGAVEHAITRGVMTADGAPVCYGSGTFLLLPPPPGVKLAPLPWQLPDFAPPQPLEARELDAKERGVVRDMEASLARGDDVHAFMSRFWGVMPKQTSTGAACRVRITPQIGNRVGHVQGGIMLGLAQATASAAVPRHPFVSTISAWYISPGHGKALSVRSKVVHAGRSFAVVKTEIRNADRSLVLEVMSNHASTKRT